LYTRYAIAQDDVQLTCNRFSPKENRLMPRRRVRQQATSDQLNAAELDNAHRLEQEIDALIDYLRDVKPYLPQLAHRKDRQRFKRLENRVFRLTSCIFDDVIDKETLHAQRP
jgi:hypothetical protein